MGCSSFKALARQNRTLLMLLLLALFISLDTSAAYNAEGDYNLKTYNSTYWEAKHDSNPTVLNPFQSK